MLGPMTALPPRLLTHENLQDLGLSPSSVWRAVRRTELLRVRHGVYAPLPWWRSLDDEARLRQMHLALALRAATAPVFGHASAALLHGLHLLHRPAAPHVVSAPGRGSRNNRTCVHHWAHLPPEHVVRVDGLLATSLPRTVVDCAATLPVREALVIADHALHRGTDVSDLVALVEGRAGAPGCRQARRVLDLADGRSESPGETLARLVLLRGGLPRPELQVRVATAHGAYRGDMGWRTHRLLLEFDGQTKYVDHGPADRVVLAERRREKELTNAGWRVLRTDWATVTRRPERLVDLVRAELARRPGHGRTP
jgi:very-short-patch-repair endonuclease